MKVKKAWVKIDYGVHHGKMMLLFYPKFLRVIISTANLLHMDYHRKTQGIWYQDFPPKKGNTKQTCDFEVTLVDYLQKLQIPTGEVLKYDFTSAKVIVSEFIK